jgi:hypothetical protein
VHELRADGGVVLDGLFERCELDLAANDADGHVVGAFDERFDRFVAKTGGEDAVHGGWTSAPLQVAEDRDPCVEMREGGLHFFGNGVGTTGIIAFGNDDDVAGFLAFPTCAELFDEVFDMGGRLGHQYGLGTAGDAGTHGDEAGIFAHDLDKEEAVVGIGRVADLVDHLHDAVDGGVVADGEIGADEVVVDGAGQADEGDVEFFVEDLAACECAIATYGNDGINAVLLQIGKGLLAAFFGEEILAAGGFENGASALHDAADIVGLQFAEFVLYHALKTTDDAEDTDVVALGGAHHGTDAGVHAGRVAPTGENCYGLGR